MVDTKLIIIISLCVVMIILAIGAVINVYMRNKIMSEQNKVASTLAALTTLGVEPKDIIKMLQNKKGK